MQLPDEGADLCTSRSDRPADDYPTPAETTQQQPEVNRTGSPYLKNTACGEQKEDSDSLLLRNKGSMLSINDFLACFPYKLRPVSV